jgi:hypothetical protein
MTEAGTPITLFDKEHPSRLMMTNPAFWGGIVGSQVAGHGLTGLIESDPQVSSDMLNQTLFGISSVPG